MLNFGSWPLLLLRTGYDLSVAAIVIFGLLILLLAFRRLGRRQQKNAAQFEETSLLEANSTFRAYNPVNILDVKSENSDNRTAASEQPFPEVFNASPNIVFIKNKDGYYEFVNRRFAEVFEIKPEEVKGKTGYGFFPRDLVDRWNQDDRKIIDEASIINREEKFFDRRGGLHVYFVTRFPLFDSLGKVASICGIGTDITEIREYQTTLVQDKARMEAVLRSIGEGLVVSDAQGRPTLINPVAESSLGYSISDFGLKSWPQVVRLEDEKGNVVEESARPLIRALGNKQKFFSDQYYFVERGGRRFPAAITAAPIIFQDKIIGAVAAFRDISREKELEQAKDEFVSMVSHELKAPMTSIKMGFDVVLRGDYGQLSSSLKEIIGKMYAYIDRLLDLVEDVLSLSRLESGVYKVTLKDLNMSGVVRETVDSLKILAEKKGVSMTIGNFAEANVRADPALVVEVLTNLLGNAVKFTDRGSIVVSGEVIGKFLEIAVTDTGVGISEVNQTKLFKKFQQVSSSQRGRPSGTGLGLYLSKKLANLMAGDLVLKSSKENRGSVFVLSLPLVG
ncbi:MAG: PAS domain-containing sensor histidine kinase [Patescibacteria group bacterium]|nr:PAS domain-containing sensor histidine kinase [Patescibacteria group bacterium]